MNGLLKSSAADAQEALGRAYVVRQTAKLLQTPEICALGGFSRWTWRRWVRSGLAPQPVSLPGHPRWKAVDVARFLDGHANRRHFFGGAR
jgi:predicted DNA-binding transcriptional regulator AlpA